MNFPYHPQAPPTGQPPFTFGVRSPQMKEHAPEPRTTCLTSSCAKLHRPTLLRPCSGGPPRRGNPLHHGQDRGGGLAGDKASVALTYPSMLSASVISITHDAVVRIIPPARKIRDNDDDGHPRHLRRDADLDRPERAGMGAIDNAHPCGGMRLPWGSGRGRSASDDWTWTVRAAVMGGSHRGRLPVAPSGTVDMPATVTYRNALTTEIEGHKGLSPAQ
jgi:hypothetical protein